MGMSWMWILKRGEKQMTQLSSFHFGSNACHLEEVGSSNDPSYTIFFNYTVRVDHYDVELTTHHISFGNDKRRALKTMKILEKILKTVGE